MKEKLQNIVEEAHRQISQAGSLERLNEIRVAYLGKKGELTSVLKSMKDVAPEDRPKVGQLVNEARAKLEEVMEQERTRLAAAVREAKMKQEVIDVTLRQRRRKSDTAIPIQSL